MSTEYSEPEPERVKIVYETLTKGEEILKNVQWQQEEILKNVRETSRQQEEILKRLTRFKDEVDFMSNQQSTNSRVNRDAYVKYLQWVVMNDPLNIELLRGSVEVLDLLNRTCNWMMDSDEED
jgi:predicted RNase H-like nuclease (RuvC/YqgF family)